MSSLPDTACITNWARQTGQGDFSNSEQLVLFLRSLLTKRFIQLGLHADESEELAQECLIDVIQNLAKFDSERSSLPTWVNGFARTSIRSWRRREYGRRSNEINYDSTHETAIVDERLDAIDNSVSSSLQKLHVIDQELLHMRFNLGLSFDEISERTDMTSANARKRLSRAVERLRRDPDLRVALGLTVN